MGSIYKINHWLIPANIKYYDVLGAFNAPYTYWPINCKIAKDDIVYIYLAAPYKQLAYKCEVKKIAIEQARIIENVKQYFIGDNTNKKNDKMFMQLTTTKKCLLEEDSVLSLKYLKLNGLNGMLMGARKLANNPTLLNYIQENTS